jgi:hypothetical protein
MQPAPLHPPSFSHFEISEERGFLPVPDPLSSCSLCPDLEWLGQQLPKLLAARQLRNTINTMQDLIPGRKDDWTVDTYRFANRILSFVAHAYIWENPDHPLDRLPANLAVPWYEVSHRLGRPPVLSYASYALDNWRRLDPDRPIELDNIVLLQNFLGGLDEEWFVAVHVDIEAKAGAAMAAILRAQEAVFENQADDVITHLTALASAQEAMCSTLDRMPERCDPFIYYHRVRPFIHGWKNNPALPNGLVYEGVEEYQENSTVFSRRNRCPKLDYSGDGRGAGHYTRGRSLNRVSRRNASLHAACPPRLSRNVGTSARPQRPAPVVRIYYGPQIPQTRLMAGLSRMRTTSGTFSGHTSGLCRDLYSSAKRKTIQQSHFRRHRRHPVHGIPEETPGRNQANHAVIQRVSHFNKLRLCSEGKIQVPGFVPAAEPFCFGKSSQNQVGHTVALRVPCAVRRLRRRANSLRSNNARLFSGVDCTARPHYDARRAC